MQARLVPVFLALALISAPSNAQEISTKARLLGVWQNSHNCVVFPTSVTIMSANDTGARIESTDSRGHSRAWSDEQTRVSGPPTGPDIINLKFDNFEFVDGNLRFQQTGPDGIEHCVFTRAENPTSVKSYIPKLGLEKFIVDELDIRSFGSSLHNMGQSSQARFSELGLEPTSVSSSRIMFESAAWTYVVQVLRRGDLNHDGIEDISICFSEKAKYGPLYALMPLLLTKYSATTPLVAIAYRVDDPACKELEH